MPPGPPSPRSTISRRNSIRCRYCMRQRSDAALCSRALPPPSEYPDRMTTLPQDLHAVHGPFDREQIDACASSLGDFGTATRHLVDEGLVPPDVLMGLTLTLLSGQPRTARAANDGSASAIEGNVWVREQVTIHRPCGIDELWTVTGTSARRYVRKGRRYGVTVSRTVDAAGSVIVSNCTTGLLSYRSDESLDEVNEGLQESEVHIPIADHTVAMPVGDIGPGHDLATRFPIEMTLELMQRRDGKSPKNPIHSDPAKARRAGLAAPIAGGSHVAAFVFELLMREWGVDVLLHGAHIDVRWKSPTFAGDQFEPTAVVISATPSLITIAIAVEPSKLQGTILIPRTSA